MFLSKRLRDRGTTLSVETEVLVDIMAFGKAYEFLRLDFDAVADEPRFAVGATATHLKMKHRLHVIGFDVLLEAPCLEVPLVLPLTAVLSLSSTPGELWNLWQTDSAEKP